MKKIVSVLAVLVVFFCSSLASARLNDNEIAVGGLGPGSVIPYAISIYGQPDEVSLRDCGRKVYCWGKGFEVRTHGNLSHIDEIDGISITANNGISTPQGIHVGSKSDDILKAYGKPDKTAENKQEDAVQYTYMGTYRYMEFIMQHGTVLFINVLEHDPTL